jgi:hypothetical protein
MARKPKRDQKMWMCAGIVLLIAVMIPMTVCAESGSGSATTLSNSNNASQNIQSSLTRQTAQGVLIGDCNRDGVLTSSDALTALQMSTGKVPVDLNADTNGDGQVTSFDAVQILRASTRMIPIQKGSLVSNVSGNEADPDLQSLHTIQGSGVPVRDLDPRVVMPDDNNGDIRMDSGSPRTLFDLVASLPMTILSYISGSPAPTDKGGGSLTAEIIQKDSSVSVRDGMPLVVASPDSNVQGAEIVQVNEETDPEIVIHDTGVPVVQVHMIESPDVTPTATLPPVVVMSIPTTGIAYQPEVVSPVNIPCPTGYYRCSGICVDLMNDISHCGSCNSTCPSQYACMSGVCIPQCSSGQTKCNGACVNLLTDPNNCGSCGNVCMSGATCSNGHCVAQMVTTQPTRLGDIGQNGGHL